jgi:UDP-N-acetylglucosamine 2-epimerase (non-hydrolysing)
VKVGIVLGTRPEIIKLAPLIGELEARGVERFLIHTNQHYDWELDARFFEELELTAPDLNLGVGSGPHGEQTAKMLAAIEAAIQGEELSHVVVQGDTNSGLAGALAAAKLLRSVVHVEAGLRSYDMRMPEELNRRLIDHISDHLFPPTATAHEVLAAEAVQGRVHSPSGNTVVDAVLRYASRSAVPIPERERRILMTLHRPENVDDRATLEGIVAAVAEVGDEHDLDVLFPVHPRTRERLRDFAISLPARIEPAPLQSFRGLLELQATSRLVMTDSGGVQEEACVLGTPCVVVRSHTDRPETIAVGASALGGIEPATIVAAARAMLALDGVDWDQPFGDGTASRQIVDALLADADGDSRLPAEAAEQLSS